MANITKEMVESKIRVFFPKNDLERFEIVSTGLANINIFFKLKELDDSFLLRIYNRNDNCLDLEILLSERYRVHIPMPEFLYIQKETFPEKSFVIQRWINGVPFYKFLETAEESSLITCANSIAYILSIIARQKFEKAGFFKNNLEIEPFDTKDIQHPFVSYIEDCLFKENAGIHLGEELRNRLWNYIVENQDFFPKQEPACLVHGDFNFDNILVDPISTKVAAIVDWEFAFPGSYLFDIGTFLRFDLPGTVKDEFINSYERYTKTKLPSDFEKMVKVQDLANFVGLINDPQAKMDRISDVKRLILETLEKFS